ncbi:MAG: phosphatase PAP2 family protein, partial [Pseudomonadota bacterium]
MHLLPTFLLPGTPPRIFWLWLMWRLVVLSVVFLVFFRVTPSLDIGVSRMFFDPDLCAGAKGWCAPFFGEHDPFLRVFQEAGVVMQRGVGLVTLLLGAGYLWTHRASLVRIRQTPTARMVCAAALSLFLGPILLVNWILKAFWGRPRPRATDLFLGDDPFILPGTYTDYCLSNCSFVSGEASGAFWFFALLPLLARFAGRDVAWAGGVVLAVLAAAIAYNRVVFGAHYLSDVVMAATLTLAIVAACHWWLSPRTHS